MSDESGGCDCEQLQRRIEMLEKHIEKINERYMKAIEDVQWYHLELRRYIKQGKITERRIEDGKAKKRRQG